jgi:hypothetical protein
MEAIIALACLPVLVGVLVILGENRRVRRMRAEERDR